MNKTIVARKYATALMDYYQWYNKSVEWIDRCLVVADFLHRYRKRLLYISLSAYCTIFNQLGLTDMPVDIMLALLDQDQRIGLLPFVLMEMARLYRNHHGIENCVITSAAELTEDQKTHLKNFLEKMSAKKLYCQYKNDTSLIAGIRAQGESFYFEDSVAKKLRALQHLVT